MVLLITIIQAARRTTAAEWLTHQAAVALTAATATAQAVVRQAAQAALVVVAAAVEAEASAAAVPEVAAAEAEATWADVVEMKH